METIIKHKYNIGDKVYYPVVYDEEEEKGWRCYIVEETVKAIAFNKNNKIIYVLEEGIDFNNNAPEEIYLATREEAIEQLQQRLLDLFNKKHERNIQNIDKILDRVNNPEQ